MAAHQATTKNPGSPTGEERIGKFAFYGPKIAAADLRRYHEHGPQSWTKTLLAALSADGFVGATILDIGGGVGVIGHELLRAGASAVTYVEASSAYLAAARAESEDQGQLGRSSFEFGDFVDLGESIAPADIVTLDRVLNVYPEWERLAAAAADHARLVLGVVVPRKSTPVRVVIAAMNAALRLQRQSIRAKVIPIGDLDSVAERAGLVRDFSEVVGPWQVLAYRRAKERPR